MQLKTIAGTERHIGCQVDIAFGRQVGIQARACREAEMGVTLSGSATYTDERQVAGIARRLSEV